MSGPQINAHANELQRFLTAIRENRNVHVCNIKNIHRILYSIGLKGAEDRPLTDQEISTILNRYKYFRKFFAKDNLWPDELDSPAGGS